MLPWECSKALLLFVCPAKGRSLQAGLLVLGMLDGLSALLVAAVAFTFWDGVFVYTAFGECVGPVVVVLECVRTVAAGVAASLILCAMSLCFLASGAVKRKASLIAIHIVLHVLFFFSRSRCQTMHQ